MRKGHKDFVTVVGDIERGELLEVINSHRSEEIIEVSISSNRLRSGHRWNSWVSICGVDSPKWLQRVFPNAVLVYDRFHVMKLVNQELNKLRKTVGMTLQGSHYLLLKNKDNLSEEQQFQLEQVLNHSCCLRIAYELKEEFRQIYQTARTPESGKRRFQTWLNHAQQLYQESSQTIRDHKDGICNYFIRWQHSQVLLIAEAIKAFQRACRTC